MRLFAFRRDLVCQQAVELVTDYLEGTLSRAARRRFEAHLAGCPHCTEYLARRPLNRAVSAVSPSAPASGSMTTAGSW